MKPKDLPAFPIIVTSDTTVQCFGITIRDYFAAKAMQTLINVQMDENSPNATNEEIVKWSYEIADAMLKEREK